METRKTERRSLVVQAYTLKELIAIYRSSRYRLLKKLNKFKKEIGERQGYFYETEQVTKIFALIPLPSDIDLV